MSAVARYIRFDDYPVREKLRPEEYEKWLFAVLRMCEESHIRYILGVVPQKVTLAQAVALRSIMRCGRVVMHGFDHAYDSAWMRAREQKAHDWQEQYKRAMDAGGEFAGMFVDDCANSFVDGALKLGECFGDKYNPEHFIAPFNRYTENLLSGIEGTAIEYIHTSDECQHDFDHHGIIPVISHYKFGYDYAGEVVKRIEVVLEKKEQITMHWFYDCTKRPHWSEEYRRLLDRLAKESEYVAAA